MTCDDCGRATAVIHLIEIKDGRRTDRNLCQPCATAAEVGPDSPPRQIDELLRRFVGGGGRPPPDEPE